uniref:Telomerase RNA component interacting RNase n=1 Tax=Sinocyclocheilus rhinocerous TaxID=307959 RepID=A0A673IUJ9_9TELE
MEKKQHKSDKHHRHHPHPHPHQSSSSSSGESGGSSPAHGAPRAANAFANDGSFMELFKKKISYRRFIQITYIHQGSPTLFLSLSHFLVGFTRESGRLPLGSLVEAGKGDAWTKYMAEVKKYKAHQCGDDDKTRPLVK